MAVAEKQQQNQKGDCLNKEIVGYVDNQVLSELTQKSLRNGVEPVGEGVQGEVETAENKGIAVRGGDTMLVHGDKYKAEEELCSAGFAASVGRDVAAGDREKEVDEKQVDAMVMEKTLGSLSEEVLENKTEEVIGESVEQIDMERMEQLLGCSKKEIVVDADKSIDSDGTMEAISVVKVQSGDIAHMDKVKDIGERKTAEAASVSQQVMETVAVAVQSSEEKETLADNCSDGAGTATEDALVWAAVVEHSNVPRGESNTGGDARQSGAVVKETAGLSVTTLADDVVGLANETVSLDVEPVKLPSSSVCMPHLSADEAMELLEAHQNDSHGLLPEHDEIADADIEVEPKNCGYQWFDGDDEDDEGIAIEVPSVLDVAPETTDDVFGFGGTVDLADVTQTLEENGDMNSDASADTLVVRGTSSSSSSSSASSRSSSSSSSSSASYCSSVNSSEDESVGSGSKKRRASGNNGPRKPLKYKKQKRVRSPEPDNPSWRRLKRKRKIPKPFIPSDFAVFDREAADPILKGSYSVRKNRRACFQGNWGFSDEAFHDIESVSPFEYTSHARVLLSRRKDDKRPISGKYGGFFKLRQFNGTLVKIREDQLDLQFLPMPSSDEEDGGDDEDMEGYESDEGDTYEVAASRYIVLGKGKNRFGRFLIRGYLSPKCGRLTVKRRYLE